MSDSEEEVAFESADEGGETDDEVSSDSRKEETVKSALGSRDAEPEEEKITGTSSTELSDQAGSDNVNHTEECSSANDETTSQETDVAKEKDSDTGPIENSAEAEKFETAEKAETIERSGNSEEI